MKRSWIQEEISNSNKLSNSGWSQLGWVFGFTSTDLEEEGTRGCWGAEHHDVLSSGCVLWSAFQAMTQRTASLSAPRLASLFAKL